MTNIDSLKLKQSLVDIVRQRINLNYFFICDGNMSGDTYLFYNESVKDIRFSSSSIEPIYVIN